MGNRKQPFGYKMLMGGVVIHPREAQAVQEIFQRYLSGASFGDITDWLQNSGPAYDAGKTWNKNMVARILEDNRYTGTERFPAILTVSEFKRAAARRAERKPVTQGTEVQKVLRRLCNGGPSKAVTEQVLTLLNRLAAQPQQIVPQPQSVDRGRLTEAVRRFADKLAESPVNEEQARSLAVELAGSSYESIGGSEYETYRLRRLFTASGPMVEISAALLRETVSQIYIKKGRAGLLLKNGQMIEESL